MHTNHLRRLLGVEAQDHIHSFQHIKVFLKPLDMQMGRPRLRSQEMVLILVAPIIDVALEPPMVIKHIVQMFDPQAQHQSLVEHQFGTTQRRIILQPST